MDECECRYEVVMLARLENDYWWKFHGGLLVKVSSFKDDVDFGIHVASMEAAANVGGFSLGIPSAAS
jgi:hypothetical protein